MSNTLFDSVKSVFTTTLTARFSTLLAEPETNIQKAIHGAIPMILTDIVHKAYSKEQTVKIWSLSRQAAAGDFFGHLHPHAKLDKDHGNWFDFTRTSFASKSSSLLPYSEKQLKNIVAILDAFPKARIKIGGYSDNTGDSTNNVRLSRQRAEKIAVKLKELGARPIQITGAQGYGPLYAVADNGTAEGRATNRRMSIDVKAK